MNTRTGLAPSSLPVHLMQFTDSLQNSQKVGVEVRRTSDQLERSTEDADGADEEVDECENQDGSTYVTEDS